MAKHTHKPKPKPKPKPKAKAKAAGGKHPPAPPPDGICILGSNPKNVDDAPFKSNWLIYTCSPHNIELRTLPSFDEWFEVHNPIQHESRSYRYLRGLEDLTADKIVWMRDKDNMGCFKGGQAYPEAELKEIFCPFMFTSTISFIMAKAIVDCKKLKIKKIGIWGVMQASPDEYAYQRPGIQYFIWEAFKNWGIEVVAPEESKLFDLPKEIF